MPLSATGGCVWCALGARSLPSEAKDESRVAEVQMPGAEARRDEYDVILSG